MPRPAPLRPLFSLFAAVLLCASFGPEARAAEANSAAAQHKTTQSESYVIIEPLYASILDGARSHELF